MDEPKSQPEARKAAPASNSWTVGLVLVAIGAVFLLRNLGVDLFFLKFDNWWALIILAVAVVPLSHGLRRWSNEGFNNEVAGSFLSALILVTVALLFLLHLQFFTWWPIFVIYGGIFMLITNRR